MIAVTVVVSHEKSFSKTSQNLGVTSVTLLQHHKKLGFMRLTEGLAVTVLLRCNTSNPDFDLF